MTSESPAPSSIPSSGAPELGSEQRTELSADDLLAEQAHYQKVLSAYRNYLQHSLANHRKRKRDFMTLPSHHRKLISPGWEEKWDFISTCIRVNAAFIDQLIAGQEDLMDFDDDGMDDTQGNNHSHSSPSHHHTHAHAHPQDDDLAPRHQHHANHQSTSSEEQLQPQVKQQKPTEADMDKVRSTIRQFVRDWSDEVLADLELLVGLKKCQ